LDKRRLRRAVPAVPVDTIRMGGHSSNEYVQGGVWSASRKGALDMCMSPISYAQGGEGTHSSFCWTSSIASSSTFCWLF
jgi:hypothetical protein